MIHCIMIMITDTDAETDLLKTDGGDGRIVTHQLQHATHRYIGTIEYANLCNTTQ